MAAHKIGWSVLLALLLISFLGWFYLVSFNIQERCVESLDTQNVKVAFNTPAFFSVGEDTDFWVTVVNERSGATDITLELRYAGTVLCRSSDGQSYRAEFGSMHPQERASRKMMVSFPLCLERSVFNNWPGEWVEFAVWLTVDSWPPEQIGTISLPVIPVPKARTLGKWINGWLAGLVVWMGKELWDRIKEMTEPSTPEKALDKA